jgi:serine/threonine protein kinase
MDRVVRALASGETWVEMPAGGEVVQYLIFELANADVRKHLAALAEFDMAWALRSIHHIAVGVRQLHTGEIAHQDLKPSNVLVFNGRESKIADLGRASLYGKSIAHDEAPFPGDPTYCPPEFLYGHIEPDWIRRRFGSDLYMLGSMIVFFFTNVGMTTLLLDELEEPYRPETWEGTYEEVLPYVHDAMGRVIGRFEALVRVDLTDELGRDLSRIVRELCDPLPVRRGHPSLRRLKNPCDLERYITRFDILARKAEMELFLRRER